MRFAQLTDLHICPERQLAYGKVDTRAYLANAIERLNNLKPALDAVVISGDLVDHGTTEEYDVLRPMLDTLSMPWWPIPGNHDSERFWTVFSDRMPDSITDVGYVIEFLGIRFVMLDTRVNDQPHGALNTQRIDWLSDALSSDMPVVLVMHHPPFDTGIAHMDKIGLRGRDHLPDLLQKHRPLAVLCGHIHRTIMTNLAGVPVIVAPSPAHAVAFDLSDDGPAEFKIEPPGILVHLASDRSLVSHTVFIEEYDGPWSFFDTQRES